MNIPRLLTAAGIGIAVALFAGLHAVSMLATKQDPKTAIVLFPANGEAYEAAAFEAFTSAAENAADLQPAAAEARELAIAALKRDPASAKSHALLALARSDLEDRKAAALSASRINRRDLTLQGLVLDAHIDEGDYAKVIETLDQIMRVHVVRRRDFYPLLGQALIDPQSRQRMAEVLDGSSQWHEFFFTNYAIGQPDLLPGLAELRMERDLVDADFDRQLIAGLVESDDLDVAAELFVSLTGSSRAGIVTGQLDWSADYPPFDWKFTDQGDFRAQQSRDGERLEIFARPGKGGIIAQRILPVPAAPFTIQLTQASESGARADAVRIELRCPGVEKPFFAQPLEQGANTLLIADAPACEQMQLAINARAFSGQPALRTELDEIKISGG